MRYNSKLAARRLEKSKAEAGAVEEQVRLHRAASRCFGAFASGDARRSENVREAVRERLRRRHSR
jgi:hypothetical protein